MASRDLNKYEIEGFSFLISWFESWRVSKELQPSRESAKYFWRDVVLEKKRERWQTDQWAEAMRWFLNWLEICELEGNVCETLGERLRNAVFSAGARRGLSRNTLKTYASWVLRFGKSCSDEKAVMDLSLIHI